MNNAFSLRKEDRDPKWRVLDASGQLIGRLASEIAIILRGKDKVTFTPHQDAGDYVVVKNCDKAVFSGNKMEDKVYVSHSGYRNKGFKVKTAKDVIVKHPTKLLFHAVKGMLPKNKLSRALLDKLKLYTGDQNPHTAQTGKN